MRRFIYVLILVTAASQVTSRATAADEATNAPWQITVLGQDRGVIFLTFATDFTATGYGISLAGRGPFDLTGTWSADADGNIVGGFTEFFQSGSRAGLLAARIRNNGGFLGRVKTTEGTQKFKAPAAAPIPDLSGNWTVAAAANKKKSFYSFTLAPTTNNLPGWFELTGAGVGETGSFTLAGAVLVTSDRNVAGFTISDFGTTTSQAAFIGKVTPKGNKLVLRGKDENSKNVTLKAQKPQP